MKIFCTQNVSECRLGKEPRGVVGIFHIGHRDCGIRDPVVDDGIHRHGHRVFGQNL